MRQRTGFSILILVLTALSLASAACDNPDPRQEILDQRARWEVQLLNWAQDPGGDLNAGTRVIGPPNSSLKVLTVRFLILDASGTKVGEYWHTYDLADVPRGGPSDILVRVPDPGRPVDGLAVDMVYEPDDADAAHMSELAP